MKSKNFFQYILKRCFSNNFTHVGPSKMVNISQKQETLRFARASCKIIVNKNIIEKIQNNSIAKGDILRITEIAGIMAAKKTSEIIPLCHPISLNTVNIKISLPNEISESCEVEIESFAESISKTGVEMEAMVAVSAAALTFYDMCKSVDKGIIITDIKLLEKAGGKSGNYKI